MIVNVTPASLASREGRPVKCKEQAALYAALNQRPLPAPATTGELVLLTERFTLTTGAVEALVDTGYNTSSPL